jgi:Tfp pilus assembly protein PilF
VNHFEAAVRLNPASPRARTQLAVALVNTGRLADAVPQFEAALQASPDSAELHRNLAEVLRALGRPRDALRHFEEATRLQLRR